jgi:hypothetical protein
LIVTRWADRVTAVEQLLGSDAMVFEERAGWVIGICTNRRTGPPYAIDVYGEGPTFDAAWAEAARRRSSVRTGVTPLRAPWS